MSDKVIVYIGRTIKLPVSLGRSVVGSTLTSEIRTESGTLIATWTVTVEGDGSAGDLTLTLDNTVTAAIAYATGLMDMKEVIAGEPYPVWDGPLEVEFRRTVTA